ncbi:hypothetical protein ACFX15_012526 [Malus domestica]
MSHFLRKVLVLHMLLMVILLNTNTLKAAIFDAPKEISVKITNVLESNENLTVHCKSGDNDLGVQAKRDDCSECPWSIFQAGPCLYGPKGICYQWNRQ